MIVVIVYFIFIFKAQVIRKINNNRLDAGEEDPQQRFVIEMMQTWHSLKQINNGHHKILQKRRQISSLFLVPCEVIIASLVRCVLVG